MTQKIDIRLERDPRYVAATVYYTKLQAECGALERQRDEVLANLNSLGDIHRTQIEQEATALLSGDTAPTILGRGELAKTFDQLTHRVAVLRQAVSMQKAVVEKLRGVVGTAIATDLLPQHRAIVTRIADAVFELNSALEAEHDLRDALYERNVPYSAVLRSTQFPGFGSLRSPSSRVSGFILSLYEDDLIPLSKIPEKLIPWAKAKKHRDAPVGARAQAKAEAEGGVDGWGNE